MVFDERCEVFRGDLLCGSRDTGTDFSAVLGEPTYVGDHAEVDGKGGETFGCAVVRESVLEGVAGGIVGLGGIAHDAGEGGEHDEEVERGGAGGEVVMEVLGAMDFG